MGTLTFELIEQSFRSISETRGDIKSALVFGSRARVTQRADQWSDLDLMAFVERPGAFLERQDWLSSIGEAKIAFAEQNVFGQGIEVRVLFDDGLDVDFLFFPCEDIAELLSVDEIAGWLRPGYRILADKDGRLSQLLKASVYQPASGQLTLPRGEFNNVVADFFFHLVWTTKKLLRGEVLTAKTCCDIYMKDLLLRMIVWNARMRRGHGHLPLFGHRYFEKWADPETTREFSTIYAHYDSKDILRAVMATSRTFSRVARETATLVGHEYPAQYETYAHGLVARYTA